MRWPRKDAAHRHDGSRHSAHAGPARPGLRGQPLHRHSDLRLAHAVGSVEGRRTERADSRPRHLVGGGRQGQDQVGLQAAPRRQVPRRLGLHRRRRGVERAEGARQGRRAVRPQPGRRDGLAHAHAQVGAQDRRHDGRTHHQRARRLPADQPHEPVHGLARALAEEVRCRRRRHARRQGQGRLDRLRRRPRRLRPVQGHALRGARAAGAGRQQGLLGRQARAEDRQGRDAADARGQCAHRRAAGRSGRLDRGARARRHGADHAARLQDLFECTAPCVALAALVRRRLALARQARAPGRQPVHRPRRHEAAAGRHDGRAQGHGAAGPPVVSASPPSTSSTT